MDKRTRLLHFVPMDWNPIVYSYNLYFIQPWSGEAKEVLRELKDQPCAKPFVEPVDLDKYSVSTILAICTLVMVGSNSCDLLFVSTQRIM